MIIADITRKPVPTIGMHNKVASMFFIANKKKVLIIDDDPSLQRLLHVRLEACTAH